MITFLTVMGFIFLMAGATYNIIHRIINSTPVFTENEQEIIDALDDDDDDDDSKWEEE